MSTRRSVRRGHIDGFQVKDPAMLDAVKPGDKVQFKAERSRGALVITEMQVAR
ncbi:MAG: copper-binding protein [Betaproteobacteria bacterium]|nr:MAG: copper-binding protein [Betaproteobacteria bacterium]